MKNINIIHCAKGKCALLRVGWLLRIQNQLSISKQRTQHVASRKCDKGLGLIFVFITLLWVKRRIIHGFLLFFFTVINTDIDLCLLLIMFIHRPICKYFTALLMCCVLMMGHLIYKYEIH